MQNDQNWHILVVGEWRSESKQEPGEELSVREKGGHTHTHTNALTNQEKWGVKVL